jgi:hypothetical protein
MEDETMTYKSNWMTKSTMWMASKGKKAGAKFKWKK